MRSRTRGLLSLLLVVCVVLAGCNGVFGGDTQETSTLTPAAVPTDEPTRTPLPQLAPGLTGEGVVNASALAAAHDATLEDTSYTARRTVTYRTPNGTPVRRIESVTRVADDGRFRITKRWNGSTSLRRVAYYHDGDRLLVATTVSPATNIVSIRRLPAAATDATTANRTATGTEAGTTTAAARTPGTAMARNHGRERRASVIADDQAS